MVFSQRKKIYELFFLEEVTASMIVQSFVVQNFLNLDEEEAPKRPKKRPQVEESKKTKRKKTTNTQMIPEDFDAMLQDITNIAIGDAQTTANALISLRDAPLPTQEELQPNLDDFFGEIHERSVSVMLHHMENMAEDFFPRDCGENSSSFDTFNGGSPVQSEDLSLSASNDHPGPSFCSFDEPGPSRGRFVASTPLSCVQKHLKSSIFNQDISSIACIPPEDPNVHQLPEIAEEQENVDDKCSGSNLSQTLPEQPAEQPDIIEEVLHSHEELQVDPITQSPSPKNIEEVTRTTRKRKKIFQIDQITFISSTKLRKLKETSNTTLRCLQARDDIYRGNEGKLFSVPLRKRKAQPLMELFERNCKIQCVPNNFNDILADIMIDPDPNNNLPLEETMATILEDFNHFGNKRATRKRPQIQPEIPLPRETIPVLEIQPPELEIPLNFQEISKECKNFFSNSKNDFTPEGVLFKLQTLWTRKMEPITVNVLLNGITGRMEAARTFMSIMELGKLKKLQLHRNDANLEISDIAPQAA